MNRLQFETSPYLLQHAHNPVHWYAWKPEAFERALAEDKPILVSIGYSTCHWCHVMERESFEDTSVAEFMNRHFICIKVDREERPDVDHIYMEACQAISGAGGWPLNCFLTPDGRPFYAGTYYPPRPAHNRPAWTQLLQHLSNLYATQRATVEDQAERLSKLIGNSDKAFLSQLQPDISPSGFNPVWISNMFHTLKQQFDTQHGGFGGAPKFPGVMALNFLLEYYFHTGEEQALEHAAFSAQQMIFGGLYDHLGGGFARYATDKAWLIPHFEKMLYDNALLIGLLADLYRCTGNPLYARTIEETTGFIAREMTSPEGGFYAALDADSEGVEGKYYVWNWDELQEALGADAAVIGAYFGASREGNWEGHNILWRPGAEETFAEEQGIPLEALREKIQSARKQLLNIRQKRIRPGLDTKFLLDWNALMCTAYAKAYKALGHLHYRDAAERNLNFLLSRFQKPEGMALFHTYSVTTDGGRAQYDAFLDDYANLIEALLEVYSITFNPHYLRQASAYTNFIIREFQDPETGLFYFTSAAQKDLVMRKMELFDNSTPSGNSTMALNLLKLGALLGQSEYSQTAAAMIARLRESIERYPSSFARWATAACRLVYPVFEVAVTGPEAGAFAGELNRHYLPHAEFMAAERPLAEFRLLAGREEKGKTLVYVCREFACQLPVDNTAQALELLQPLWKQSAQTQNR